MLLKFGHGLLSETGEYYTTSSPGDVCPGKTLGKLPNNCYTGMLIWLCYCSTSSTPLPQLANVSNFSNNLFKQEKLYHNIVEDELNFVIRYQLYETLPEWANLLQLCHDKLNSTTNIEKFKRIWSAAWESSSTIPTRCLST